MMIHHNDMHHSPIRNDMILGLILAGGQNRRMGPHPKWQLPLANKTIMEHIIQRLTPQVHSIVINGSHTGLAQYSHPVIEDVTLSHISDQDNANNAYGPLAGLLTGLQYAKLQGLDWVASCPCDSPFLPEDYVKTLTNGMNSLLASDYNIEPTCAIIRQDKQAHYVFGLWSIKLIEPLRQFLILDDTRAIKHWLTTLGEHCLLIDYPLTPSLGFFNINTPEELTIAHKHQDLIINQTKLKKPVP